MDSLSKQIMPLVKVKEKFQVTIPTKVRKAMRLTVGDFLEVRKEGEAVVLKPKVVVDREIDQTIVEGLEDIKKNRVSPAFSSAKAAISYLHRQAKKLKTKM
ncbi:MAG: AbrB/MazE/SpoVT family DNA-binding domain-containing protein [Candidatus Portnoybacteria bacterium]|nr:AbrB/MazE/SpoVT family DNA-binding domain-containing protein [Candidatus Portnoybacteria bacterium]